MKRVLAQPLGPVPVEGGPAHTQDTECYITAVGHSNWFGDQASHHQQDEKKRILITTDLLGLHVCHYSCLFSN